jgi:hypothetical protein
MRILGRKKLILDKENSTSVLQDRTSEIEGVISDLKVLINPFSLTFCGRKSVVRWYPRSEHSAIHEYLRRK